MKVKVSIYHRTRTIKHVVKYFPSYSQLKTWFWIFELLCAFAPTRPRETKESVKMALSMRQFVDTSKCREILNKAPKIIRKRRVILKGDDQTTPTRIPMRGLPCPSVDYLVDGQRPMVRSVTNIWPDTRRPADQGPRDGKMSSNDQIPTISP